jgi:hypothetical protein
MEPSDELLDSFRWPTDPTADWWMLTGTELGLSLEYIKFAAAKSQLGGHDSRQNSMAAEMAGLSNLTPSQAFRIARSVGVQKLLDRAHMTPASEVANMAETMQQFDATAELATAEPIGIPAAAGNGVTPFALVQLVRRFHAQVERQRRADEQLVAGLERVARDPRVIQIIQQIICEKESSRHG